MPVPQASREPLVASSMPLPSPIMLSEWGTVTVPGLALTFGDQRLADRLGSRGRLIVEEMRSGVRIQARAWVGVIFFESMVVRVAPKLAGEALGLTRLLAFTRGLDALVRTHGTALIATAEHPDLMELLATLLADSVERIVQHGLFAGYVEHEEEMPTVRGRLLADRQVLKYFGRADRVFCRFDELEYDTIENRILAAALRVCARRVKREKLHRRLRYLSALLDEVSDPEHLDLQTARTAVTYDRQNAHYRDAHALAWLILDAAGVDDLFPERGTLRSFAFLLDMNSIFEEFVCRLIEQLFPGPTYEVEPQERNWSVLWSMTANKSYRSIRPDVVVRLHHKQSMAVAIDAKYKRYDMIDPASTDIYQGLLYAQAYNAPGKAGSAEAWTPTGLLIYPVSHPEVRTERVRLRRPTGERTAELVLLGLPVRQTLESLHQPGPSPAATLRSVIAAAIGQ